MLKFGEINALMRCQHTYNQHLFGAKKTGAIQDGAGIPDFCLKGSLYKQLMTQAITELTEGYDRGAG